MTIQVDEATMIWTLMIEETVYLSLPQEFHEFKCCKMSLRDKEDAKANARQAAE